MRMTRAMMAFTLTAALLCATAARSHAQPMDQHRQMMMQQQMQQTSEMTQRMTRLMNQAHQFSQNMAQRMEQVQERHRERLGNVQRMGESLGSVAEQMKTTVERYDAMVQDETILRRRDMQQQMERLHTRLRTMTDEMEQSFQIMERIRNRLQARELNELTAGERERQMQQTGEMTQQMSRIMNRCHQFSQNMAQQMPRQSERNRERYRNMQRLSESLGTMAEQMKTATERYQLMEQDQAMIQDREMNQERERLRERMRNMAKEMEASLEILEGMSDQLQNQESGE
jgi:hypothetical protein